MSDEQICGYCESRIRLESEGLVAVASRISTGRLELNISQCTVMALYVRFARILHARSTLVVAYPTTGILRRIFRI